MNATSPTITSRLDEASSGDNYIVTVNQGGTRTQYSASVVYGMAWEPSISTLTNRLTGEPIDPASEIGKQVAAHLFTDEV